MLRLYPTDSYRGGYFHPFGVRVVARMRGSGKITAFRRLRPQGGYKTRPYDFCYKIQSRRCALSILTNL